MANPPLSTTQVITRGAEEETRRRNMSAARENLQRALCQYIKDTFSHIGTVRGFCERLSTWTDARETELTKMTKDTDQQKLAAVLKDTLGGLEKLGCFLDAVEKLAVTSLHVFTLENQVLCLPEGIGPEEVQLVIAVARMICPQLLEFKRDASAFFLPKLQNVEVLSYQLNEYIKTTLNICGKLEKSSLSDFSMEMNDESLVDLDVDLSEDDVQMMLSQINDLEEIRMNQSFRTVFLFQGQSSGFISKFQERQARMLQSLNELEENAVQLDRMSKGAKISSVAGSSVGAAGGVLTIVGLALMPFTFGASSLLMMTGLGMGVTSGLNGVVTTVTEINVNRKHQNKAGEILQSFMEDVQSLQDCLEQVTKEETNPVDVVLEVSKVLCKAAAIGKGIDSLIDVASAAKMLKSEELAVSAGKVALQEGKALRNVPRVAADLPDIDQVAVKGPLALSNIVFNALFTDSISLAKGCEPEVSQFIRARAALWRSEMDSWQKIYDFLNKGLPTTKGNEAVLEKPFYPEREMKKRRETGKNILLMKQMKKKKKN